MSRTKRYIEDIAAQLELPIDDPRVLDEAARRTGETTLRHNQFAVVMCSKCIGMTLITNRYDVKEVGVPTDCSCGGKYAEIDPTVKAVEELLGFAIKREGDVVIGDIVEPLTWHMSGWGRQLVLATNSQERWIRYVRPMLNGINFVTGKDTPYSHYEDYQAYYSANEEDQGWVKVWKDSTTLHHYFDQRRRWADKEQLEVYWQRLHFAIERECTVEIDNVHELRYACMELEQRCFQVNVPVPDMPTKEEIKEGILI